MTMNWKGFGSKMSWPNFKELRRNSPWAQETTKTSRRIAGRRGRKSNPVSPEYKAGVLTSRQRRSSINNRCKTCIMDSKELAYII
jgi:hypothetical protein